MRVIECGVVRAGGYIGGDVEDGVGTDDQMEPLVAYGSDEALRGLSDADGGLRRDGLAENLSVRDGSGGEAEGQGDGDARATKQRTADRHIVMMFFPESSGTAPVRLCEPYYFCCSVGGLKVERRRLRCEIFAVFRVVGSLDGCVGTASGFGGGVDAVRDGGQGLVGGFFLVEDAFEHVGGFGFS